MPSRLLTSVSRTRGRSSTSQLSKLPGRLVAAEDSWVIACLDEGPAARPQRACDRLAKPVGRKRQKAHAQQETLHHRALGHHLESEPAVCLALCTSKMHHSRQPHRFQAQDRQPQPAPLAASETQVAAGCVMPRASRLTSSDTSRGSDVIAGPLPMCSMSGQQLLPVLFNHDSAMTPELAQVMPGRGMAA